MILRRLSLSLGSMMLTIGIAQAGGSFAVAGDATPAKSITYYGYDYVDRDGNHVCLKCEQEKASEQARQRGYEERRERAREHAIRMGQIAGDKAKAAPSSGNEATEQKAAQSTAVDIAIQPAQAKIQ